jgi:hypothetical protein
VGEAFTFSTSLGVDTDVAVAKPRTLSGLREVAGSFRDKKEWKVKR